MVTRSTIEELPPGSDAPRATCTRRVALLVVASAAAGCAGGQAVPRVASQGGRVVLPFTTHPTLASPGGTAVVSADDTRIFVMRSSDGGATARSMRCTHQGCIVSWDAGASELQCPCHGSRFSADGQVLAGPAEDPLPAYEASVDGDSVVVRLEG